MSMNALEQYKILTFTHKTTPLKTLGRLVIQGDQAVVQAQLEHLKSQLNLKELLYLATCNRVLFFFVSNQDFTPVEALRFLHTAYPEQTADHLQWLESAQILEGQAAIQHLFEVASSIDSLVVGEREILRQLRQAFDHSRQMQLTGDSIRLAMRYTVEVAKDIYTHTRIGEKPVSVVSLSVQQLLSLHPSRQSRILLVGAGQTNNLVAKLLKKEGFQHFTIFNRSLENAQGIARGVGGRALPLSALETYKEGFDVLIACTGATEAIITPALYSKLVGSDTQTKILIDLSIPNNIDKNISQTHSIEYIEIEDLQQLAQENLSFRQQEVEKAKQILLTATEEFGTTFKNRQIELALREVPTQIKAVKDHAMNQLFREEVDQLDEQAKALLEKMMNYMEKRCIAIPLQIAKENLVQKI
jgi:glutamyl-tRNA reductase